MPDKDQSKLTHFTGSKDLSPQSTEARSQSPRLSRDIAMQLFSLMTKVSEKEITPATVRASCECAKELHKLLKLNFDMRKAGLED